MELLLIVATQALPRGFPLLAAVMASQRFQRMASGLRPEDNTAAGTPIADLFRMVKTEEPKHFLEAVRAIGEANPPLIPNFERWADGVDRDAQALKSGGMRASPLSADELAAVIAYSSSSTRPPLYEVMNKTCYEPSRSGARIFVEFMWLLLCALSKLPPYPNSMVFRGVKLDTETKKQQAQEKYGAHSVGREVTWHGFASCTAEVGVMDSPDFCGREGDRIIFLIQLTQSQGRSIYELSGFAHEKEVLLPPGCRFIIRSTAENAQGQMLVQLEERPGVWIEDLQVLAARAGTHAAAAPATTAGDPTLATAAAASQSISVASLQAERAARIEAEARAAEAIARAANADFRLGRLRLAPMGLRVELGDPFCLQSVLNGLYVHVEGECEADGARVHLWDRIEGCRSQQWFYNSRTQTIHNMQTLRGLDAYGGGTWNGVSIHVYHIDSQLPGKNQQWHIKFGEGDNVNHVKLVGVGSGKPIHVDLEHPSPGHCIHLWDDSDLPQVWWRLQLLEP